MLSVNMNSAVCFSDKSAATGRPLYKGICNIDPSTLHVQCYKYIVTAINIIIWTLFLVRYLSNSWL